MHPLVKIISLITIAIYLQFANLQQTVLILACFLTVVLYIRAVPFVRMVKRVRWLMIVMLVIYAFSTPGEYVQPWFFETAPTYEGLRAGSLQAVRLLTMLAGLSVLLASSDRNSLITGLYLLLKPMQWIKTEFNAERFAARLWLTLHYVENPIHDRSQQGFLKHFSHLKLVDELSSSELETIWLTTPEFTWRDMLAIWILIILGVYLL